MSLWEVLDTQRVSRTLVKEGERGAIAALPVTVPELYLAPALRHTTAPPAAALTLLPPPHSTASLNAAILAPVGLMIELWSPPGHIHTAGPVMKLWIFHPSPDTNCLFAVHPLSAVPFSAVCVYI